ncbi:hypothetical protein PF010_g11625 [Phytophthora fragariae]|uniref:Uncharacterized protein n=1 Tax=Phytophthora fragariae TaxID=53985 RepID=A0A6G0L697_9STRA|nr:hypothetical protein PF010_g11625 [Phytophthora fragariae]
MPEVCDYIEEPVAPAVFDGTNVADGYLFGLMAPSNVDQWALAVDPIHIFELEEDGSRRPESEYIAMAAAVQESKGF